jgi:hypothetical protein
MQQLGNTGNALNTTFPVDGQWLPQHQPVLHLQPCNRELTLSISMCEHTATSR